jgi:hypothetical protein
MTAVRGELNLLRKMLAHYRMLPFLPWGPWRSAKATIRTFGIDVPLSAAMVSRGHRGCVYRNGERRTE